MLGSMQFFFSECPSGQLKQDLKSIGVCAEDTLMVHASLRAVGPIEGRAEGLVRTLRSVLGKQGTLVAYVDFEPTQDIPSKSKARSSNLPLAHCFKNS